MPKTITIPTTPGFINSSFSLFRAVAMSASPFSGKQRTQEYDSTFWQGQVSLPPMKRSQAALWQSFFLNLEGNKNYFLFGDPDAKTPQGTYNGNYLHGETRVDSGSQVNSVTLTFSGNTITAGSSIFDGLVIGDFITVSGATNEDNNGTHKVTSISSNTALATDADFVTESSTASCKVRQNVKGSTALSLQASSNSATGTIKAGDYLAIYDGTGTGDSPIQLVMATEDATRSTQSGKDHYSVKIQPKLRQDLGANLVGFSSSYNKSQFRLAGPITEWDANHNSNYGFTFEFVEVV